MALQVYLRGGAAAVWCGTAALQMTAGGHPLKCGRHFCSAAVQKGAGKLRLSGGMWVHRGCVCNVHSGCVSTTLLLLQQVAVVCCADHTSGQPCRAQVRAVSDYQALAALPR